MLISEAPFPLNSVHMDNNILFELIKENSDFSVALVYLATYEKHKKLDVIPYKHSIRIYNEKVTVAIVIYAGFEKNEYLEMKEEKNLHIITFSDTIPWMIEFEKLKIKQVDKMAWLFRILQDSKNHKLKKINRIKKLRID